jgi:hypothetical protein
MESIAAPYKLNGATARKKKERRYNAMVKSIPEE